MQLEVQVSQVSEARYTCLWLTADLEAKQMRWWSWWYCHAKTWTEHDVNILQFPLWGNNEVVI